MRRKMTLLVLLLMTVVLPANAADIGPYAEDSAASDGRLIYDNVKHINRPRKDRVVYSQMILKSGDAVSDRRKVIIKEKTYGGLSRGVFRFTDSMKRGLTFLTIETHGNNNDQYLYVPAIGRPRQVASQDRQNNFEDTDLTNEDLGGLKLDDYTYLRGKDTVINERPSFKVTATAKAADARFPRRISWIDQQTFVPLQIKIYNKDNKLARVVVAGDVRALGGIYIPFKTVAKDLLQNHTTILEVVRAEVDSGIDELVFDKEEMGAPWKENF
ncbi:MAG: hypothetical protein VR64_01015 [Desulfatitalea sp. BRH_c12]|nr:MAG: hypothetical protein VR64_01015 [Desulfatitalea sp. BRH_c12]